MTSLRRRLAARLGRIAAGLAPVDPVPGQLELPLPPVRR